MLESLIQSKIVKRAKKYGFEVIRLRATDRAGRPDLILLSTRNTVIFVEVKRPGEQCTPLQLKVHNELRRRQFRVEVMYSEKDIDMLKFYNV